MSSVICTQGLAAVETLLQFGVYHKLLEEYDVVQVRNQIYDVLHYKPEEIDESLFRWPSCLKIPKTATMILNTISNDYFARGYAPNDTVTARDLIESAVMGRLMPRQSEVAARFKTKQEYSPEEATKDFYALCRASNYIQVDRIKKDMYWTMETEYGIMELTVNLSKPEKNPKDIEAQRLYQPVSAYPKCPLCLENVGFYGTITWPSRQNLRVIPVILDGDPWYFQYSPYSYYNEHCIILSKEHTPMKLCLATFRRMIDFVKRFPHYFLGSNADLPIVGGSILSHDHFQGGCHVFPMEKAKSYQYYVHDKYLDVSISLIKWPVSVIRLTVSLDKDKSLVNLASDILTAWREYSEGDIVSFSGNMPHNTITPIARIKKGKLELDLALRNNRTSAEHPFGIFHPHEEWHHVKKENIGLIEVMGLAVLPSRLKYNIERGDISMEETARVFVNVLKDCGVFKDNNESRQRFDKFMKSFGCRVLGRH